MNACKYCESKNIIDQLRPDTMHYGEWRCLDCERHIGWMKKPKELPELIEQIESQLQRTGYTWQSIRVLDFCERACGQRDYRYLRVWHLQILLRKLNQQPTSTLEMA